MSVMSRFMMQAPYAMGTGSGQSVFQQDTEQVINAGRVTRCVTPPFDPSKGWAGVQRGIIPPISRQMQSEGWQQTGNRCGPGGYGVEYIGPQTPFIGTAPGFAGLSDPPPRPRAGLAFALLAGAVILGVASVVAGVKE
jgi:hypothetical protein